MQMLFGKQCFPLAVSDFVFFAAIASTMNTAGPVQSPIFLWNRISGCPILIWVLYIQQIWKKGAVTVERNSAAMRVAGGAILLWLILVSFLGCSGEQLPGYIPDYLTDLKRKRVVRGQEAAQMIGRLHGRAVPPESSFVAYYGPINYPSILYVTRFPSAKMALETLEGTSRRIGGGTEAFTHHGKFPVGRVTVHFVLGQSRVNFFFARDSRLYWLAIDPDRAQEGLAQILDVPLGMVPTPRQFLTRYYEERLK